MQSTSFYKYVFDNKTQSERFYTNLTDEDIKYIEAANRSDYEECFALLDQHFQKKMPNTKCKHEVWRRDGKSDIWVYQARRKQKHDAGWLGEGIYFYGAREEAEKAIEYGFWLQAFYLNIEYPFVMDRHLHEVLTHSNNIKVSERLTQALEKHKMDGVFWSGDMREEWCALNPCQIKRKDITRDDEGRIIPLSRRFDLSDPDNRY